MLQRGSLFTSNKVYFVHMKGKKNSRTTFAEGYLVICGGQILENGKAPWLNGLGKKRRNVDCERSNVTKKR